MNCRNFVKLLHKYKQENERLRAENRALTRVVSKLTTSAQNQLLNKQQMRWPTWGLSLAFCFYQREENCLNLKKIYLSSNNIFTQPSQEKKSSRFQTNFQKKKVNQKSHLDVTSHEQRSSLIFGMMMSHSENFAQSGLSTKEVGR